MYVFHLAQEIHKIKPLQYEGIPPVQLGVLERVAAAAAVAVVKNVYSQTRTEDQDTSRKLPLCPLARALGSVRKTQFEGVPFGPAGLICSMQQAEHAT